VPDLSGLFTPFKLRGLELANRIVMPAMGLAACEEGAPNGAHADYYARRATGGASLIVTEGVYIDHPVSGDNPLLGRFYGARVLDGWRNVAAKVHAAGAYCIPELWHVGLIYRTADVMTGKTPRYREELGLVSPSGYIAPGQKVTEGMTQAEIDEVIDAYARGAAMAKTLGFDGINIQGGHGFLIDQFLWSETNKREDHYGGSPRARARFACEVVAECRRRVGPDQPIVMRISKFKTIDYKARIGATPAELEQLLTPLVDAGVDLFDCSQRRFWEPAYEESDLNFAGWVKKVTGAPTMTIGSIGLDCDMAQSLGGGQVANRNLASLDELARRFDRGDFDLVGVGRAMIAQPDWAHVVKRGALEDLRPFSPNMIESAILPAARAAEEGAEQTPAGSGTA
jgi:2,4-dienoyl-CoA reductase-like NADH-dependent reductase (Old Yellow Enzyme family)